MLDGIDVSKWQGQVNWAEVSGTGTSFAVSRATIGENTVDEWFTKNFTRSQNKGLVPGAYHVVTGDGASAKQADNFKRALESVGYEKGLLVLDVELHDGATPAQVLDRVEYLADFIRQTYGRTPIIYTGHFWREFLGNPVDDFGCKLWLAAYTQDAAKYVPKAWKKWDLWQYTDKGAVAGVTGNVDLNKYDGTIRELKTLAGWEWDELATQAEIRTIVKSEVAAAINACNTNTGKVVEAVSKSESNVRATLTAEHDELVEQIRSVVESLETDQASADNEELKQLVTRLHKHLCLPCTAEG